MKVLQFKFTAAKKKAILLLNMGKFSAVQYLCCPIYFLIEAIAI